MEKIVKQGVLKSGNKEYPETITQYRGRQTVEIDGEMVEVESVTYFESKLGCSVAYVRAREPVPPEVRAANRRRVQEIATQAMINMGIW